MHIKYLLLLPQIMKNKEIFFKKKKENKVPGIM